MTLQNASNRTIATGTKVTLGGDAAEDIYKRNAAGELVRIPAVPDRIMGYNAAGVYGPLTAAQVLALLNVKTLLWSVITATTQAIAPNSGYVANNTSRITFPLPATAVLGDEVRIVGQGTGGWRVAQASGQSIVFGDLTSVTGTTGYIESTHAKDCVILHALSNNQWQVASAVGILDVKDV